MKRHLFKHSYVHPLSFHDICTNILAPKVMFYSKIPILTMLDFAITYKGPCLAIANNVLAFCSVPLGRFTGLIVTPMTFTKSNLNANYF